MLTVFFFTLSSAASECLGRRGSDKVYPAIAAPSHLNTAVVPSFMASSHSKSN
jgi:hypothetical protein